MRFYCFFCLAGKQGLPQCALFVVRICPMGSTTGVNSPRYVKPMHAFLAHLGRTLALPALLLVAGNVTAAEIWIVTDARHPVAGAQAADRVIQLDAAQAIEAELSARLPDDPQRAAALVQRRLNEGGDALQQHIREAYQGVTDAWSLGITSIPAVIVDQRYVVYGKNDLDHALARIERYREEQP